MAFLRRLLGLDAESLCDSGLSALGRRDYAVAAEAFRSCTEASRREATIRLARFHLAECHTQIALEAWHNGEAERARAEMEIALAYAQPTAERHLIAAQLARHLGDRLGAAYHAEAALARLPGHEPALALYALNCYEEGRLDEALARIETLPRLDGRLRRFREAHERGDRATAVLHLAAVAAGYPESLL